jgi:NitT/TauT family transport system substrate-binding protein
MNRTAYLLSRRRALWLMGGVAGGVALHGCTQTSSSSAAPPLISSINPWIGYSVEHVAYQKGLFKAAGVEVQELFFQSPSESITSFLAGKVDVAWLTSGDTIQAISEDPTIRMIYVVDYSNGSDGIIARGISSPADLKGKTIARENVLFENVLLRAYLAKGGLTEKDVVLKDLTAGDSAAAFAAKRVDAAVTFEPWMTKAAKEGGGEVIFSTKDTNLVADVIAVRQKTIETRKADLQAYLKAVDQAAKLVIARDPAAIAAAAEKFAISPDEVKTQLDGVKIFDLEMNQKIGFNLAEPNNVLKNFEVTVQTAYDMKLMTEKPQLEALYDDSIVKSL